MTFRSDELYKASKIARDWIESHWQKDGTNIDIEGRPYKPRVFEAAVKKYEAIADELRSLGLPEYPEKEETEKCEHEKSKLSIIDECVHCVCGVTWPKELTKHFSILK